VHDPGSKVAIRHNRKLPLPEVWRPYHLRVDDIAAVRFVRFEVEESALTATRQPLHI
jgi:hypothetical protein